MKKILSLLSILLMFNACSEKEGTIFDFDGKDYWSFYSAKQNFETDETGKSYVYLYHLNPTIISSVDITVEYGEDSEGLFFVGETSFDSVDENNKAVIEITYNADDLEYNVPYTLKFSIPEQAYPFEDGLVNSVTVTIIRPLTFKNWGIGIFISEFFGGEWEQPILLADQASIFQLPDWYESGYPINIIDNGDGTVTIKPQPAWYYDEDFGVVYVVGEGIKEGNMITIELEHIIWNIQYSFGIYKERVILPD